MTPDQRSKFPRWYDWLFLLGLVAAIVVNGIYFGLAGVVVYGLLLFAAYRLGKAIGR